MEATMFSMGRNVFGSNNDTASRVSTLSHKDAPSMWMLLCSDAILFGNCTKTAVRFSCLCSNKIDKVSSELFLQLSMGFSDGKNLHMTFHCTRMKARHFVLENSPHWIL
ncbi:hypothetical protein B566_EDAN003093 [Ephemera danica]|nr:hypothetical protein B566_EDAN003093 [Ephemera danica]